MNEGALSMEKAEFILSDSIDQCSREIKILVHMLMLYRVQGVKAMLSRQAPLR